MVADTHCSAIGTLLSCPSSQQPTEIEYDPPSDAADLGTAVHVALATHLRSGSVDIDAVARSHRVDATELAKLYRSGVMAWEQISESVERVAVEQPIAGNGIRGTADAILFFNDGGIGVLDWKSNRERADVEPQLLGYASCVESSLGLPPTGNVKLFTAWLRLYEIDVKTIDGGELEIFNAKVARAQRDIGRRYAPGTACTYCKRQLDCKARTDFLRTAAAALMELPADEALADTLPRLYERSKALAKALDAYRAALRMVIKKHGEVDDGNGGTLRLQINTRQTLKPQETWAVLQDFGFSDEQIASCMDISRNAAMDVIAATVKRGQKGKKKAELQAALEAGDAIKRSTYDSIKQTKG